MTGGAQFDTHFDGMLEFIFSNIWNWWRGALPCPDQVLVYASWRLGELRVSPTVPRAVEMNTWSTALALSRDHPFPWPIVAPFCWLSGETLRTASTRRAYADLVQCYTCGTISVYHETERAVILLMGAPLWSNHILRVKSACTNDDDSAISAWLSCIKVSAGTPSSDKIAE